MTENALITNADLLFDDVSGRNGRNFKLTLQLKTIYGGVNVSFNPMQLPQLLEQLGLERFSELKGTYVQIPKTDFGEECKGIKSIMAKDDEEWFESENHIYFGSEFKPLEDLKKENEDLKKVLGDTLIAVKRNGFCSTKIEVGINPSNYNLMVDVLKEYGALKDWYE